MAVASGWHSQPVLEPFLLEMLAEGHRLLGNWNTSSLDRGNVLSYLSMAVCTRP